MLDRFSPLLTSAGFRHDARFVSRDDRALPRTNYDFRDELFPIQIGYDLWWIKSSHLELVFKWLETNCALA